MRIIFQRKEKDVYLQSEKTNILNIKHLNHDKS